MNVQDIWMETVAMIPNISDAEIKDHLSPIMNPLINWIQQRLTHEEKLNAAKSYLEIMKVGLI